MTENAAPDAGAGSYDDFDLGAAYTDAHTADVLAVPLTDAEAEAAEQAVAELRRALDDDEMLADFYAEHGDPEPAEAVEPEQPACAPTFGAAAPIYLASGWQPLPVVGGKGVTPAGFTGYAAKQVTAEALGAWAADPYYAEAGVCLRLDDMIGIDLDAYAGKGAAEAWAGLIDKLGPLPATWLTSSRLGDDWDGASGIRLFRLPPEYLDRQNQRCWWGQLAPGIDVVRKAHRQANVWPQVHPSRAAVYAWLNEATGEIVDGPIPCSPADLPELPKAWAEALLKPEPAPRPQQQQASAKGAQHASAGGYGHRQWWTEGEPCPAVRTALEQVLAELEDDRHDTIVRRQVFLTRFGEQGHRGVRAALHEVYSEYLSIRESLGVDHDESVAEWHRAEHGVEAVILEKGLTTEENRGCCGDDEPGEYSETAATTWPAVVPLIEGSRVPFPVDALPVDMAAAVREVAEAVKGDPAISAQAALGVLAGLVGPSTEVVINATWRPRCNIWVATVAGSTDGKSPGVSPFWAPLNAREAELKAAASESRLRAEVLLPVLEAQLKKLQKANDPDIAQLMMIGAEVEAAKRALGHTPRVFVDDCTPERMAQIMASNDGVITAVNDEGSLFTHLAGMYTSAPNMGAILKAWEGSIAKIDRKGGNGTPGDELVIERPCLTLIAAVQPVLVGKLGTSSQGLEERGLLGRVLWAWPPSHAGERMMVGHHPEDYQAVPAWNARVEQLATLEPATVEMSPEAQASFYAWHDQVEAGLTPGGVYADLATFAPKIRESVARIAGLFARADGSVIVTSEHVARAVALGEFYLAHTMVLVESWASGQIAIARKLLAKIKDGNDALTCPDCTGVEVPDGVVAFRVREAYRAVKCRAAEVIDALEILAAHGYVRPADPVERFGDDKNRLRKVSPLVLVNPEVWG